MVVGGTRLDVGFVISSVLLKLRSPKKLQHVNIRATIMQIGLNMCICSREGHIHHSCIIINENCSHLPLPTFDGTVDRQNPGPFDVMNIHLLSFCQLFFNHLNWSLEIGHQPLTPKEYPQVTRYQLWS